MVNLLEKDKYISYKEYQQYCKDNNVDEDIEKLEKTNNDFIDRKLIEYKDYFDNLFKSVGEDIVLDEEQRRIILTDEDYCLVNAGAGSGKSTTMAGKVKYLVDKLGVDPKEIIMLSFTKKSSEDLDEKVNGLLNLGIPVSTFHSLGMKFIKKNYSYPVGIVSENDQKDIIRNYIIDNYKNKEKIRDIIILFEKDNYNKQLFFKGFIDNYEKYNTFDEYFDDYKKRKYQKESEKAGGIKQYLSDFLNNPAGLYTIKGDKVKSFGEYRIANFLYSHSIDYTYEKIYEEKVNESTTYHPDFTINYNGKKIYVEYFGLSNCYNADNELLKKEYIKYQRTRKDKENFQKNSKDDFINLDYIESEGDFIQTLKSELEKRNIKLNRRSDDELFFKIVDNNMIAEFFRFVDFVRQFISTFKNMLVNDSEYMFDKRIREISEEHFSEYKYSERKDDQEERKCRIKAVKILKEVFFYYDSYLKNNHMVDYDDMIILSYKTIIEEVKNKFEDINYKYIIVDEYQDITFQRYLFVKKLIDYFDAKLLSVGDDWQSIYAFTGSRLELFNHFSDFFSKDEENVKDDLVLSTTYRYGQELADITSEFVLKNEEQSYKKLKAIKNLEDPIVIYNYYGRQEEYEIVNNLIKEIYKNNPDDNILILSRINEKLKDLCKSQFFTKGANDVIICNEVPNAKIEAITMHRSKGLSSDQTIIIGLTEKVFPSKGKIDHWVYEYFHLDKSYEEKIPFAEERRIFYVALTRTKNRVYLVVPIKEKSQFVTEIEEIINNN